MNLKDAAKVGRKHVTKTTEMILCYEIIILCYENYDNFDLFISLNGKKASKCR